MLLISTAAGVTATLLTKPLYASTTRVFVSTQTADNTSDLLTGSNFTQQRVKSYADVVTSPSVLTPVVKALGLEAISSKLAARITANVPLNTVIIEITVLDESPYQAAAIANAVSDSLTRVVGDLEQPVNGAASPVRLSTVQPGDVAIAPDSPKPLLNLALSLFIGLVFGVGLAILIESLDLRVRNAQDVETLTESNILGGIAFDPDHQKRPLIVQSSPKSSGAESFRQFRTNVQFVEAAENRKTVVLTSSIPNEGKTSSACNLAIALADTGARVLLVDGDFRKPDVNKFMGLEGSVGLSNYLIGQADLDEVIQPWGAGRLHVLPAGQKPPNPSELLGSQAMTTLLEDLESRYDSIVIDAPPLLPVTDAAILSKICGGLILVVAVGKTTKPQLEGAVNHIKSVDGKILGALLNMIPTNGADAMSYHYGYGYGGYGYGYGYGQNTVYGETKQEAKAAKAAKAEKARKALADQTQKSREV